MKEINKYFIIILIGFCTMVLFSCRSGKLVNFESDSFEKFKNQEFEESEFSRVLYFSRITTAVWVDLVIVKYSKDKTNEEIIANNIMILDDKDNVLYQSNSVTFDSYSQADTDMLNNYYYKVYSYKVDDEDLRTKFRKHKTKYLIINFEIDGKGYSDKLKRVVERYPILRT
jgi:hypothetical protein